MTLLTGSGLPRPHQRHPDSAPDNQTRHTERVSPHVLAAIRICPLAATKKTPWPSQSVTGLASRRTATLPRTPTRRALGCPRRQSQVRRIAPVSGRAPTAAPTPCTTPAEICVPGTRTPPPTGPPTPTPAPERDVPEVTLGSYSRVTTVDTPGDPGDGQHDGNSSSSKAPLMVRVRRSRKSPAGPAQSEYLIHFCGRAPGLKFTSPVPDWIRAITPAQRLDNRRTRHSADGSRLRRD